MKFIKNKNKNKSIKKKGEQGFLNFVFLF